MKLNYQAVATEERDPEADSKLQFNTDRDSRRPFRPANIYKFVGVMLIWIAIFAWLSQKPIRVKTQITSATSNYPNIVIILTDDQGMGDMDLSGSDFEGLMPRIRTLNEAGLNLSNYYSLALCTPARSALLTGRYPISNGMQHGVVQGIKPWGLPVSEVILPQYLRDIGYGTHIVGKWHLGHHTEDHLPTARGFDSFFGYLGGYQHPQNYWYEWPCCANFSDCIPDFHRNRRSVAADYEAFNTYLIVQEAVTIIERQSTREPLFLYVALPLLHMPVLPDPAVEEKHSDRLQHLENPWRRSLGAMAIMLDDAVGAIADALEMNSLMSNTILVFASDNGAQVPGSIEGAGSNFPLRGSKGSLFEGGTRVPAFVYSPVLGHSLSSTALSTAASRRQVGGLFHATDWLPTLLSACGEGSLLDDAVLDGIDQWPYLQAVSAQTESIEVEPPRTQLLYNADPLSGIAAVRDGDWKLIVNESTQASWLSGSHFGVDLCGMEAEPSVLLFNLSADPEERTDLSGLHRDVVESLRELLDEFISSSAPLAFCGDNNVSVWDLLAAQGAVEPWTSTADYQCASTTTSAGWCASIEPTDAFYSSTSCH